MCDGPNPFNPTICAGGDTSNLIYLRLSLTLQKVTMASLTSQAELQKLYIGKDISDVPKPAAILDVAIIRRHCETMLHTVKALNVGFRAHVKSHKVCRCPFSLLASLHDVRSS